MQTFDVKEMLAIIDECIKTDRLLFLANMILKLQKEYQELAALSTSGEYETNWTHKQLMDFITYLPER